MPEANISAVTPMKVDKVVLEAPELGDTLNFTVPAIAMTLAGLLGAAFAVRSVVHTDPLAALNAQNS